MNSDAYFSNSLRELGFKAIRSGKATGYGLIRGAEILQPGVKNINDLTMENKVILYSIIERALSESPEK